MMELSGRTASLLVCWFSSGSASQVNRVANRAPKIASVFSTVFRALCSKQVSNVAMTVALSF